MFTVYFKEGSEGAEEFGRKLHVKDFDGGGIALFEEGKSYEVHCYDEKGEFTTFYQKDVEMLLDSQGDDFEDWGNPYFPGHPYS